MAPNVQPQKKAFESRSKPAEIRSSNIEAAKGKLIQILTYLIMVQTLIVDLIVNLAVADAIRTSLGPRGMDKMVSFFFLEKWVSADD